MDQKLNALDLGISRFSEHNLVLVWKTRPGLEQLRAAAESLLIQWPILGSRLDFQRTSLLHSNRNSPVRDIWKCKISDRQTDEIAGVSKQTGEAQLLDFTSLERLVDFGYGLSWNLRQDVLAIRTVILHDGCVIGFKLQHPFGDATAMMRIAKAYCAFVDGKPVDPLSSIRPSLDVKSAYEFRIEGMCETNTVHPLSKLHAKSTATGWVSFLKSSWRQKSRVFLEGSSRRIPKTLFIPQSQINVWAKETKRRAARVTEHDLILSFLYQHFANNENRSPNFGITMNIQRQLQHDVGFGNPWILVPVPPLSHPAKDVSPSDSLVGGALHIRHTINLARDPQCVSQIIAQHASLNGQPIIPKYFAERNAHALVTSWAGHPVYGYELGTETPVAVLGNVSFCTYLRKAGMVMDDLLVVWKGNGGFWIHGCLEDRLWKQMAQSLK